MPRCKTCGEKMIPRYSHDRGADVYRHDHRSTAEGDYREENRSTEFPENCPHCGAGIGGKAREKATYSLECPVCESMIFREEVTK